MSTNWAVFPSGFSITVDHDEYPSQAEMKEGFKKAVGEWLLSGVENDFYFEATDPVNTEEFDNDHN